VTKTLERTENISNQYNCQPPTFNNKQGIRISQNFLKNGKYLEESIYRSRDGISSGRGTLASDKINK